MIIRGAEPKDAAGMCDVLNPLIEAGGTTALRTAFDTQGMTRVYIARAALISCSVAEEEGQILGFQSLEWADSDQTVLPTDWGIIATFARLGGNRRGIGTALFQRTVTEARQAGVSAIDATIRRENTGGQIYYRKMGFEDWASSAQTVSKRFDL